MAHVKGTLIPIGGNEDKGFEDDEIHRLDYIEEGILSHVVQQAGGIHANIVVIPTASSIPKEVGENYLNAFSKLGCKDVTILDIKSRKDAISSSTLKHIKAAHCVMFSGGDQSKIAKFIGETTLHQILLERYKNDTDFVIAGTSAGAMAMAEEMIAGGSSTKSFVKDAVKMKNGLGLIPQLVIDTHFIQRGRFGRLAEAVAKHPSLLGIGLAEDTGIIIKNGKDCTVIGSGMALIFDPRKLQHNNEKILKPGTPMSLTNMKVHVLANGDRFNINNKKIKILPLESPFV